MLRGMRVTASLIALCALPEAPTFSLGLVSRTPCFATSSVTVQRSAGAFQRLSPMSLRRISPPSIPASERAQLVEGGLGLSRLRGERQAGRNFFMRWATGSSNSIVTAKLKYRCELCNCAFERKKNYEQHMAGQQHRSNVAAVNITWERFITCASKWGDNPQVSNDGQNFTLHGESVSMEEVVQAWSMEELERFPMRATCLSPRTFFADLPLLSKARLWKYVSELMPCELFIPPPLFAFLPSHLLALTPALSGIANRAQSKTSRWERAQTTERRSRRSSSRWRAGRGGRSG